MSRPSKQSRLKVKSLSDDAVDAIAAVAIIALIVTGLVYWLSHV